MKRQMMIVLMLLGAGLAMAQSTEEAVNILENGGGAGIRAMGMGRAYVAVANDHTALYWNPAGLAMLKNSEVGGGYRSMTFNNEATFLGETTDYSEKFTRFSSAAFAYKFPVVRGGMGLAMGYHRVKDFDEVLHFSGFNPNSNELELELDDGTGNYDWYYYDADVLQTEELSMRGGLGALSLGLGLAVSPNLSVGITVSRYTGSSTYDFAFYQDDVDNIYKFFPADIDAYEYYEILESEYKGYGAQFGAMFSLSPDLRIGATVDVPTTINVKENYDSWDMIFFDNGDSDEADLGTGVWQYDVVFPARYNIGAAFNLRSLVLSGAVQYVNWSEVKFQVPESMSMNDDYASLIEDNIYFKQDFRSTLSWGIGGELRMPGSPVALRGGYHVAPSPIKDAESDLDRKTLSFGLGYRIDGQTTLELAYTRSNYDRITSDGWTIDPVSEKVTHDKFMAGLTVSLPNW